MLPAETAAAPARAGKRKSFRRAARWAALSKNVLSSAKDLGIIGLFFALAFFREPMLGSFREHAPELLRPTAIELEGGLDALEAEALSSAQANFAMLPTAEQDALLSRLEARQVSHPWPIDPARFFQTVIEHVIEGYYSDPGNGGNRGATAWRMIGYVPGVPEGK